MAYFGENWDDNEFPLAYLITIRTYGTWLHGDERSSVDTHDRYNVYGTSRRPANAKLKVSMSANMKAQPMIFDRTMRDVVHAAVEEVCSNRDYWLRALNVRSNHLHAVVSAQVKPEPIANAFKSYATRKLREQGLVPRDSRIWARGRSRRYLWKEPHVAAAIEYVLYYQGDLEFEDWYEENFDE